MSDGETYDGPQYAVVLKSRKPTVSGYLVVGCKDYQEAIGRIGQYMHHFGVKRWKRTEAGIEIDVYTD